MLSLKSYREMLGDELESRNDSNEKYSLRKFAGDLGLSPSFLSMIMNRKRNLREKNAQEIIKHLTWNKKKKDTFIKLVRYEETGSESLKDELIEEEKFKANNLEYKELSQDIFCAISQWYHNGILALVALEGFQNDSRYIAKKLGITSMEAEIAVNRLLRLQLLENKDDTLIAVSYKRTIANIPSQAVRKFHKQMLQKAEKSIETQSMEERDLSGIMLVTDPKLLPEAKAKILDFRRSLGEFLANGENKSIYYFSTQLFRLDKEDL